MSRVIIIGCGGVAQVAIHKCCMHSEVFTDLCIASRTKSKCDKLNQSEKAAMKKHITVDLEIEHFIPVSVIKNLGIDQVRTEISKLINE